MIASTGLATSFIHKGSIMFKRLITATVVTVGLAAAGSVFASSGYGPAPHYNPTAGAPASQRGVSNQTINAEFANADTGRQSYGGVRDTTSQSGVFVGSNGSASLFAHH
jgi:hypothetical protein